MKNTILEHKGFRAQIMEADRLKGEGKHRLPPGSAVEVYPTDAFEEPLPNWKLGPGNFVVGVRKDKGLWFDFRLSDPSNTSVLMSIKGMNPITGQRLNGFKLERYSDKCPIHDVEFQGVRFCKECGYKWAPQNYVALPNKLWWDGYFSNMAVRQFFFTEDMARSIPEKIIGKDDTVPAFGFAFYRTKVYRQSQHFRNRDDFDKWYNTVFIKNVNNHFHGGCFYDYYAQPIWLHNNTATKYHMIGGSSGTVYSSNKTSFEVSADTIEKLNQLYIANSNTGGLTMSTPTAGAPILDAVSFEEKPKEVKLKSSILRSKMQANVFRAAEELKAPVSEELRNRIDSISDQEREPEVDMKKEVGVGAGAEIDQDLELDPLPLSGWEDEPASVIRVNFVFKDQLQEIIKKGMKDLVGHKEGYLADLPVG